jgi:hypothetical protein
MRFSIMSILPLAGPWHWSFVAMYQVPTPNQFSPIRLMHIADTMAHVCNPSFWGGRKRRIMIWRQPGQKVSKALSQRTGQAWWVHIHNPSYVRGGGRKSPEFFLPSTTKFLKKTQTQHGIDYVLDSSYSFYPMSISWSLLFCSYIWIFL